MNIISRASGITSGVCLLLRSLRSGRYSKPQHLVPTLMRSLEGRYS
jgi:hypothetical protein